MPIRRKHRYFYPIDWKQLSAAIRFVRAQGRCEGCGRPHLQDGSTLATADGGTTRRGGGGTAEVV